jgi:hypothetical protein
MAAKSRAFAHSERPGLIDRSLDHFGACRLRSITHGNVHQFRAARLAQKTRTKSVTNDCQGESRALDAPADAECFQHQGRILRSPFAAGDSLISFADENKRKRILTRGS